MVNGSIQENKSDYDWIYHSLALPSSECIAWLTVFITESVAIVTLNFLTVIIFIRSFSLRKRSMYLIINLAVADMLVGGFTEVMFSVRIGDWPCSVWSHKVSFSGTWMFVISSVHELFPFASLTNLAAISLERMHATFRPFRHRAIKNWVLGVAITVTWVVAGVFSTATTLMLWYSFRLSYFYVWSSFISICLFIIFVSYTSIAVKVYCGARPHHNGAASRERKLSKTLFIITLVSLMTWLPFAVLLFINNTTDIIISLPSLISTRLDMGVVALCFGNSLVNPILYTIRMPEFRRALVSLFRRQQRQVQVQIIPLPVIPCNHRR